jgi:hypothetical protein
MLGAAGWAVVGVEDALAALLLAVTAGDGSGAVGGVARGLIGDAVVFDLTESA